MSSILFAGLAVIAALVSVTVFVVFRQAGQTYHAAVDRCHDGGGAWVNSGPHSYSGSCLRTSSTAPWPPVKP